MINKERLIKNFIEMVGIASVSGQEDQFRDFLIDEFNKRGLEAREDNAGQSLGGNSGNLLVNIPGNINAPAILFSAHMDTVIPGENIKAFVDTDEVIRSEGPTILGSDDKAGVAAIMEAYDVIIENKLDHPPLEFLFTVQEEQGLKGSKLFDYSSLKARRGYVLDAGGAPGSIIIKSPCQNEIEYIVHGRASHAGINPQDGINAVHIMGKAISKMRCGRIDDETTCNFGIIGGGKARNIVPEDCHVKGEVRSISREKLDKLTEEQINTFKAVVESNGAKADVKVDFLYSEVNLSEENELIQLAVRAAKNAGLEPKLESTGGGSDASIINGNNIPCANLGIGMTNVHSTDECILVSDLVSNARMVLEIIKEAKIKG